MVTQHCITNDSKEVGAYIAAITHHLSPSPPGDVEVAWLNGSNLAVLGEAGFGQAVSHSSTSPGGWSEAGGGASGMIHSHTCGVRWCGWLSAAGLILISMW